MFFTLKASLFNIAMLAAPATDIVHAEHHDADASFPPFDPTYFASQIFWLLIFFAALYFILSKIFLPRIGETLEERSSRIADDLDSAALMQREAEEAEKAYERSLADARAKAHNVSETTRKAIEAEVNSELEAAELETSRQSERAEARIREVRSAGMEKVESIAVDVAQDVVEKMLGKKLSVAAIKKAIG
jgi:F-type H+-transporting ATPase subunit b